MSVHINKKGKLIIEIETSYPANELVQYRNSIYSLISQRNEDCTNNEAIYYGLELLRQMEPSEDQLNNALARD